MVPPSNPNRDALRRYSLPAAISMAGLESSPQNYQPKTGDVIAALHMMIEVLEVDQAEELVRQARRIVEGA